MANYITLVQLTQQGAQQLREIPNRVEQNRANIQKLGCELKSWHLTLGQYDVVAVFDAPNEEAAARASMLICSTGNAKTQTLRAFTMDEFKKLLGGLP